MRFVTKSLLTGLSLSCVVACGQVLVEQAFPNISFSSPVDLQDARDGTNRLFVVEQAGTIRVFENSSSTQLSTVFLDIRDRVVYGGEQGLLGLAFHPNFKANGYFYVNYTAPNPLRTVIARYSVNPSNPNQADKNSEVVLLQYNQPYTNHNGGQVSFGPDGDLYIAAGDGGSGGDPQNNAQNLGSLLGKILRIDVNNPSGGKNYGIPQDNPFVGNTTGYREEIYAYGLRNPWRFSFDPVTSRLWAGDVGQNRLEEIDIIEKGKNYGWRVMEGNLCYNPPTACNTAGLELPVLQYGRTEGISITGGFVYRGTRIPQLTGAYIYGDYGSGHIWALRYDGVNPVTNTEIAMIGSNILTSFGVDKDNELYICAFDGKIYQLKSSTATAVPEESPEQSSIELMQNYPNPFNGTTAISFHLPAGQAGLSANNFIQLKVFDVLGNEIAALVNGHKPAGRWSVSWDAGQRPSGVYFCRLQMDGYVQTTKLILIQ
jgi:glucose/arabinose dehydrogenase